MGFHGGRHRPGWTIAQMRKLRPRRQRWSILSLIYISLAPKSKLILALWKQQASSPQTLPDLRYFHVLLWLVSGATCQRENRAT